MWFCVSGALVKLQPAPVIYLYHSKPKPLLKFIIVTVLLGGDYMYGLYDTPSSFLSSRLFGQRRTSLDWGPVSSARMLGIVMFLSVYLRISPFFLLRI